MNRTDCQPALPHFMPVSCDKVAYPALRLARMEQWPTVHRAAEPCEDCTGNWESFWIDLGGEA